VSAGFGEHGFEVLGALLRGTVRSFGAERLKVAVAMLDDRHFGTVAGDGAMSLLPRDS
jgi:hypothetical protein